MEVKDERWLYQIITINSSSKYHNIPIVPSVITTPHVSRNTIYILWLEHIRKRIIKINSYRLPSEFIIFIFFSSHFFCLSIEMKHKWQEQSNNIQFGFVYWKPYRHNKWKERNRQQKKNTEKKATRRHNNYTNNNNNNLKGFMQFICVSFKLKLSNTQPVLPFNFCFAGHQVEIERSHQVSTSHSSK